jgi:alkyl sulfatase BDS1-like metallo-beta-lactamase superfamily hydrolase
MERFLEAMAAGLNGPDAEGKDLKVNLVLTDTQGVLCAVDRKRCAALQAAPAVRQSQCHADADQAHFCEDDCRHAGVKDTLLSDDLKIGGSKIDLVRFFGLIDKAPGTFAIVTK